MKYDISRHLINIVNLEYYVLLKWLVTILVEMVIYKMIGEKFHLESSLNLDVKFKKPVFLKNQAPIKLSVSEDEFIKLIKKRRTIREYTGNEISFEIFSKILYSSYGITYKDSVKELKASPSAGARFPIRIYVAIFRVENLKPGIYLYDEKTNSIVLISEGDYRKELHEICLEQDHIKTSSFMLIMVARSLKTTYRYGDRGFRYIYMDSAYISENIYLASTHYGVGTCAIGAFSDKAFNEFLSLDGVSDFVVLANTVGSLK